MLVFSFNSVMGGMALRAGGDGDRFAFWHRAALAGQAFLPGFWLCFSLSFARGNFRAVLRSWRPTLVAAFLVPAALAFGFRDQLILLTLASEDHESVLRFGPAARALAMIGLVASVLVLANLERTFRASVGTTRWRVKYMVLGAGVLFGTRIYTLSQALLFPEPSPAMIVVNAGALGISCVLMAVGYSRSGLMDLEVYPSRAVLHHSATLLVVGAYLFVVGVLAELVSFLGGPNSFAAQAFIVLLGIAGLAALLLSDRFRVVLQRFISRNFRRPEHDFRKVWSRFSRDLSGVTGVEAICAKVSRLIAGTFEVLSVTIFLMDRHRQQLVAVSSTSRTGGDSPESPELDPAVSGRIVTDLRGTGRPFDLDESGAPWVAAVQALTPVQFAHGGHRWAVALMSGDRILGLLVLSDRVQGRIYSQEELDLLGCIAEELGARLLNQSQGEELLQAREMEAFQAMSAFFVHDLKNAASSLNLTLQNLPRHYDNPEFREDALRGLAKTADRICQLTDRLGSLRRSLTPALQGNDLNSVVESALSTMGAAVLQGRNLVKNLQPVPQLQLDGEQIRSVITNLVLNARDATGAGGQITISSRCEASRVQLTVGDNGSGMSAEFIRNSLFRPFHSTKKQGLGIGMFQSRMIIEAHQGTLLVESEPHQGTLFRVNLPISTAPGPAESAA
ncbi:MAG: zraS 6 [Verrucomicrobiales bacterium]|nr:zraS 6 [Verrucomicrobiales bacterium]